MAAPKFSPVDPLDDARAYESPDHVPDRWVADRPSDLTFRQPTGPRLGYQGPDQGYALRLAELVRPELRLQPHEDADDVLTGCVAIGLRRSSLFGRAPVIHDLRIAVSIWGFLDPSPPVELVEIRRPIFDGLRHTLHHYEDVRALVDSVPAATTRMTPADVLAAYPAQWRQLLGR